METSLVLTVIGPDRPGIVDAVAQALKDNHGNWLESRMARLAGQFAGILRVSVPDEGVDALTRALQSLEGAGLKIVVERAAPPAVVATAELRVLELVGHDRQGIVGGISRVLAERGVNVEELVTQCTSAPMAGGELFQARAHIRIPPGLSAETLREDLEAIAHDLMVDLTLESPKS